MSIFGIIVICLVIAFFIWWGSAFIICEHAYNEEIGCLISGLCCLILCVAFVFVGIGINTEEEKVFVKKYLAQKETIEASLEVEELSGLERIELVKQATELNGKIAERKARFELWHYVVYDNTIYDDVELIKFRK